MHAKFNVTFKDETPTVFMIVAKLKRITGLEITARSAESEI